MRLTLIRSSGMQRRTAPPTFGRILAENGASICYTLEPEARPAGAPTAIPEGAYPLTLEDLATHGQTLVVHEVPGHGDVSLLPNGGLLDFGMSLTSSGLTPGTSRAALAMLKVELEKAAKRGEGVVLHVRS